MELLIGAGVAVLLIAVLAVVISRRGSSSITHDSADAQKGSAHSASISGNHGSMGG